MKSEKRISLLTYIISLVIMAIVCLVIIIFLIMNKEGNNNNQAVLETTKSAQETEQTNNIAEEQELSQVDNGAQDSIIEIEEFFSSEKYISTSDVVGAGYPSGYYFSQSGRFAYTIGEENVTKEGQTISARGTWKYDDNKLTLNVEEMQRAKGGTLVEMNENETQHLENFSKEIIKGSSIKELKIVGYELDEKSKEYIKLENGSFYQLSIDEKYLDCIKTLAENGYTEYEKKLNEYYNNGITNTQDSNNQITGENVINETTNSMVKETVSGER